MVTLRGGTTKEDKKKNEMNLLCHFCREKLAFTKFNPDPEMPLIQQTGDLVGWCPKCFYWQWEKVMGEEGETRRELVHRMLDIDETRIMNPDTLRYEKIDITKR